VGERLAFSDIAAEIEQDGPDRSEVRESVTIIR
jgi:hypothetical protein